MNSSWKISIGSRKSNNTFCTKKLTTILRNLIFVALRPTVFERTSHFAFSFYFAFIFYVSDASQKSYSKKLACPEYLSCLGFTDSLRKIKKMLPHLMWNNWKREEKLGKWTSHKRQVADTSTWWMHLRFHSRINTKQSISFNSYT